MSLKLTETISYFSEKNNSLISSTSHTSEKTMVSSMDKPRAAMHTQKTLYEIKKEHGHDCACTLAELNQSHVWRHMSSYAAVIARPFNSVTNLSFLWKPQTINHGVQLGGLLLKVLHQFPVQGLRLHWWWGHAPAGSLLGAQVSQEVRVRSLILHNCCTATETNKKERVYVMPRSRVTEGDERASVNNHSSKRTVCAFLTHHPHSVSVIIAFHI